MKLSVNSPDELLAAVPHVLGFRPEESLVLVPSAGAGLPVARVDLPTTEEDREIVAALFMDAYGRLGGPPVGVGIVCFTDDRNAADLSSRHLAQRLETASINTEYRLWADADHWLEFTSGAAGLRTEEAVNRLAAETVFAGAAQPASSRAALGASLVGNRDQLRPLLEPARCSTAQRGAGDEQSWAHDRVLHFHSDPTRLSDPDAARLLVALQSISIRDAVWESMTAATAASHVALWSDLTRRAPDEVRAAPAAFLAFSSWLHGEGARAWCALDQVPNDRPYSMAALVASLLRHGVDPRKWEAYRDRLQDAVAEFDESLVQGGSSHCPERELPRARHGGRDHGHRPPPSR